MNHCRPLRRTALTKRVSPGVVEEIAAGRGAVSLRDISELKVNERSSLSCEDA